jgi:lipase ATG15
VYAVFLLLVLCCCQEFPYTITQTLEYIKLAENAYENISLNGYLYSFENEYGLGAKVYLRDKKIVVSFKGTTFNILNFFDQSEEYNKIMDNILFKCCYNKECIKNTLDRLDTYGYVKDSTVLIREIQNLHSGKEIILTGHSLGGSIASIIGRILNIEVIAFSSPGEKHISDLLTTNNYTKITHLGACSDPIYTGTCNTRFSSCRIAGFLIETKIRYGASYCIGSDTMETILFHKIGYLKYLVELNDVITKIVDENNEECVVNQLNSI